MERIPRAIYTKELREEAVKLVTEGGLRIPEVGRRLSVAPSKTDGSGTCTSNPRSFKFS
jgi:transposase-like protein